MKKPIRIQNDKISNVLPGMLSGILVVMIIFFNSCTASRQSAATKAMTKSQLLYNQPNDQSYVIQPGDQLKVSVWNHDQFDIDQAVSNRGSIVYPLLGELQVEGLNKEQLISMLKDQLANYINNNINLDVTITRPKENEVTVLGSVIKPANYQIENRSSILEVLAAAGGPSDNADLRHVQIFRPGQSPDRINVNIDNYFSPASSLNVSAPPYQINPGDIIYIPKEDNFIRDLSGFMRDAVILFGVFRVFN
jgi:protein involved in polysaccharide export with SLBB domain